VATYTITPNEAAKYFYKIQCFCFDEQRLKPKEKVEMPVLFVVDPKYCLDPLTKDIDEIVLSYTFFQSEMDHENAYDHVRQQIEREKEKSKKEDKSSPQICPEISTLIPSSNTTPTTS